MCVCIGLLKGYGESLEEQYEATKSSRDTPSYVGVYEELSKQYGVICQLQRYIK